MKCANLTSQSHIVERWMHQAAQPHCSGLGICLVLHCPGAQEVLRLLRSCKAHINIQNRGDESNVLTSSEWNACKYAGASRSAWCAQLHSEGQRSRPLGSMVGGERGGTQACGSRQCTHVAMPANRFTCIASASSSLKCPSGANSNCQTCARMCWLQGTPPPSKSRARTRSRRSSIHP